MIIKDIDGNVVITDFERMASRTSAGAYANGTAKNMVRKGLSMLVLVEIDAINTNLLLKFMDSDTIGGTYADVDTGTAKALPGPGSGVGAGTVSSASGVHTFTTVGKFVIPLSGDDYKAAMRVSHQTTGGAASFSVSGICTGSVLPITS